MCFWLLHRPIIVLEQYISQFLHILGYMDPLLTNLSSSVPFVWPYGIISFGPLHSTVFFGCLFLAPFCRRRSAEQTDREHQPTKVWGIRPPESLKLRWFGHRNKIWVKYTWNHMESPSWWLGLWFLKDIKQFNITWVAVGHFGPKIFHFVRSELWRWCNGLSFPLLCYSRTPILSTVINIAMENTVDNSWIFQKSDFLDDINEVKNHHQLDGKWQCQPLGRLENHLQF